MAKTVKKAVLLNDTRVDRHHGCAAVVENLTNMAKAEAIQITATAPAHRNWQDNQPFLNALDDADLVLVNGEGTLHSDKQTAHWLVDAGRYAKTREKPSVLLNSTWYNNSPQLLDKLSDFDILSMRDSRSVSELTDAGYKPHFVPDLALLSQATKESDRHGIGFTDSVVNQQALGTYVQMWQMSASPVSIFYECRGPKAFARSTKRYLQGCSLFSPVSLFNATKGAATDQKGQYKDRSAFLNHIASLELLVTGRFHAMIFAMATNTPFLVVASNTPKNKIVLADSGLSNHRHVKPDELSAKALANALPFSAQELAALAAYKNTAQQSAKALFADIRALLD